MAAGQHAGADGCCFVAQFRETDGGILVRDGLGVALDGTADGEDKVIACQGELELPDSAR